MSSYIGSKVRVVADDGAFEGIIHSLDPNSTRITLNKVVSLKTGKAFTGVRNFFGNELDKLTILEEKQPDPKDLMADDEGPKILFRKLDPEHLRHLRDPDDHELYLNPNTVGNISKDRDDQNTAEKPRGSCTEQSITKSWLIPPCMQYTFERKKLKRPSSYILIDDIDKDFQAAINSLSQESILGVAAEGVNIGRNGSLCLMQFATRSHVFIFDILQLGEKAFSEGLKEVLESADTLKIFHNCRFFSDMLYNKYSISLVNIFDTQVADVIIYKTYHNGDLPRYVSGLPTCLFQYLQLQPDEVFISRVRQIQKEEDESIWRIRPLPSHMLDWATKNVVYLRELRTVMLEHLLAEFTTGINIYLSLVRDCPANKLNRDITANHKLPLDFRNLPKFLRAKGDNFDEEDESGLMENCRGMDDPYIVFSKGGMFQRNPINSTAKASPYGNVMFNKGSLNGESTGSTDPSTPKREDSLSDKDQPSEKSKISKSQRPSRSPTENHGRISVAYTAKLSPHQVLSPESPSREKKKNSADASTEVTEFTELAQRLAAMSARMGKRVDRDEQAIGIRIPAKSTANVTPKQPTDTTQKKTTPPNPKSKGPKLSANQEVTSTSLGYVFRPAGEMDAPAKPRYRKKGANSGYDTDSGVSEGENSLPQHLRPKTNQVSHSDPYSFEDYGAIPEKTSLKCRRTLTSGIFRGSNPASDSPSPDLGHGSSPEDLETLSFVSSLQETLGLKKEGVAMNGVREEAAAPPKGRGQLLRPYPY